MDLYEYQEELLLCTSRRKVGRMARRLGKTEAVKILILHFALFHPGRKVAVYAPFDRQVERIFEGLDELIKASQYCLDRVYPVMNSQNMFKQSPLLIKFKNGAAIEGQSLGGNSSEKSSATRGAGVKTKDNRGGLVIVDEGDYLPQICYKTINPIINEGGVVYYVNVSTPSGKRDNFYSYCRGKMSKYFKEIHRTIYAHPDATEEFIQLCRDSCETEDEWLHEYMAEFGEESESVFRYEDLVLCQSKHNYNYPIIPTAISGRSGIEEVDFSNLRYIPVLRPGNIRAMGVDWNAAKNGTRFIVVEYDPDADIYHVIYKYAIPRTVFTNLRSNQTVVALNRMYRPSVIYADKGYGSMHGEYLHKFGMESTGEGEIEFFDKKLTDLVLVDMNGKTKVYDAGQNLRVEKDNKPFMIELVKGVVEEHKLRVSPKEYEMSNNTVIGSMMRLKKKITPMGRSVYSQDQDHDVITLSLAIMGLTIEFSDLTKSRAKTIINQKQNLRDEFKIPGIVFSGVKDTTQATGRIGLVSMSEQKQDTRDMEPQEAKYSGMVMGHIPFRGNKSRLGSRRRNIL